MVVGFHEAWTFTALSLGLIACRVVDLGAEEAYQQLFFTMDADYFSWNKAFAKHFTNSLNRCISAVLFRDGIKLYRKGLHDQIAEVDYTAAV